MSEFLICPHLPTHAVKTVILSTRKPTVVSALRSWGVEVLDAYAIEKIIGSEKYHADMSVCHLGGNRFVVAQNTDKRLIAALRNLGATVILTENPVTAKSPSVNVCIVGKTLICDTRTADQNILSYAEKKQFRILHTNQKYTKCSTIVVAENAVITADPSIYRVCVKNNIDVLKIAVGGVELNGYDYGFIGGACGFLDRRTLAFSGKAELHPDYANIKAFIRNYRVQMLSLSNEPLYDVGGILPILE